MARCLSIGKLLYLFFHCPFHVSTCFITAHLPFPTLTLAATTTPPFAPSSPGDIMHTVRSLLIASLGFALFARETITGPLVPRQFSNISSSVYETRFPHVTWDNHLWRVTTTALDQGHYQSRQSIANGYIGSYFGAAMGWTSALGLTCT